MYIHFGKPKSLSDLGVTAPEISELKQRFNIAVIDDEPFIRAAALKTHGFRVSELGGDIKAIEQIAAFPVIVCDIRGVGRSFESRYEGAHVISEIRKAYPDKYLIAFTGMTFEASYNDHLSSADKTVNKDAPIDLWTQVLETGLRSIGDPKERWVRLRNTLFIKGVDTYKVFLLEQAFIKSVNRRDTEIFSNEVGRIKIGSDAMDLVMKFAAVALIQIIETLLTR